MEEKTFKVLEEVSSLLAKTACDCLRDLFAGVPFEVAENYLLTRTLAAIDVTKCFLPDFDESGFMRNMRFQISMIQSCIGARSVDDVRVLTALDMIRGKAGDFL